MTGRVVKVTFPGSRDASLAARLDLPEAEPRAYALFAHCFTCSKDLFSASRISAQLVSQGLGVLRFDFTGLGSSEGEFANTNFSSNTEDIRHAAEWLANNHGPASLLVGHSLGGAAVLSVGGDLSEVRAVATIGAPADVAHVEGLLGGAVKEIEQQGEADVVLAGRTFRIRRQFLEDIRANRLTDRVANIRKPVLFLHSPTDLTVGVENAGQLFQAARHPKSFVALDDADHLLTEARDGTFAARVIAAWASRYLGSGDLSPPTP
jgi:putative redox protein